MELCPNCHRKLISHASARCNWCGHTIEDQQYQQEASANRQAFFAQQALHDAQSLAWQLSMTGSGPFGDPIFGPPVPFRSAAAQQSAVARQAAIETAQLAAIRAMRQVQPSTLPAEPGSQATTPDTEDSQTKDSPPENRFGHLEL